MVSRKLLSPPDRLIASQFAANLLTGACRALYVAVYCTLLSPLPACQGRNNRTARPRPGNSASAAMVETVLKTIKSELIWRTSYQSRHHAENTIASYIDGFYNPVRRHSPLGYKSP